MKSTSKYLLVICLSLQIYGLLSLDFVPPLLNDKGLNHSQPQNQNQTKPIESSSASPTMAIVHTTEKAAAALENMVSKVANDSKPFKDALDFIDDGFNRDNDNSHALAIPPHNISVTPKDGLAEEPRDEKKIKREDKAQKKALKKASKEKVDAGNLENVEDSDANLLEKIGTNDTETKDFPNGDIIFEIRDTVSEENAEYEEGESHKMTKGQRKATKKWKKEHDKEEKKKAKQEKKDAKDVEDDGDLSALKIAIEKTKTNHIDTSNNTKTSNGTDSDSTVKKRDKDSDVEDNDDDKDADKDDDDDDDDDEKVKKNRRRRNRNGKGRNSRRRNKNNNNRRRNRNRKARNRKRQQKTLDENLDDAEVTINEESTEAEIVQSEDEDSKTSVKKLNSNNAKKGKNNKDDDSSGDEEEKTKRNRRRQRNRNRNGRKRRNRLRQKALVLVDDEEFSNDDENFQVTYKSPFFHGFTPSIQNFTQTNESQSNNTVLLDEQKTGRFYTAEEASANDFRKFIPRLYDNLLNIFCVALFITGIYLGITRLHECRKPRKEKVIKRKNSDKDSELSMGIELK
jgi:hypothetical protein